VTIHGLEYEWLPEYRNWLQRWYLPLSTIYAVKSASRLIAVSQFTKNQLVKRLKAVSKHIKVIHEGVVFGSSVRRQVPPSPKASEGHSSLSARMKVLNKWKLRDKGYVLFVGTIQPRKNIAFLIAAYAQISPAVRKQTKLVIAGSRGWMSEDVYGLPGKLGIGESVVFTGRVDEGELDALYSGAVAYVQPSITEGFGLPVLEAMANGVAVVSSDGGALGEVVGEAGMVLPVSDLVAWTNGLSKVLTQPRLRERMAAAGRWRVREFSWTKAAVATLSYLTK
jgi:glycosyltransferase involved in cell wall biosynthesis